MFENDNFSVIPSSGTLFGLSTQEITVIFHPKLSTNYNINTYLDISGRQDRIPINIIGTALGPRAVFNYDVLDIGDVFINSIHNYNINITNIGSIKCDYALSSNNSSVINIIPNNGVLDVDQSHLLEIIVTSNCLGEFSEFFEFNLSGSPNPLILQVKGHIVGPTFTYNLNKIDFGKISYSFKYTKAIELINTSTVPFEYKLYIPQDSTIKPEFRITPNSDIVQPKETKKIEITVISEILKKYNYSLVIDIVGVGNGLYSVPIDAVTETAEIVINPLEVDFGDCFIKYNYTKDISVSNVSDIDARYHIQLQDDKSKLHGCYTLDSYDGVIPAFNSITIPITLIAYKIGIIKFSIYFYVVGSTKPPFIVTLSSNTKGPTISCNINSLNFGSIPCITPNTKTITLKNNSLIAAPFIANIKLQTKSVFSLSTYEGVIEPEKTVDVDVTAILDDNVTFNDQITYLVEDGPTLNIPLIAKGINTSLLIKDINGVLDFGNIFTKKRTTVEITVENRGRRTQHISWLNKSLKLSENAAKKANLLKNDEKKGPTKPINPCFKIQPLQFSIEPLTSCTFAVAAYSETKKNVSEEFTLNSKFDGDIRTTESILLTINSNFINPLIESNPNKLVFKYISTNADSNRYEQNITIKNVSLLPLECLLIVKEPFTIPNSTFTIQPDEVRDVIVSFNPIYKNNYISENVSENIIIHYKGLTQTDTIPVTARIVFPNIQFKTNSIDFGSIMNYQSKSEIIELINAESVSVDYKWVLELSNTQSNPQYAFDIQPIEGTLPPNSTSNTIIKYNGLPNSNTYMTAKCVVTNGPSYNILLKGESSMIVYRLDKLFINFGIINYTDTRTNEFNIINTGPVPFSYSIRLDNLINKNIINVHPTSGEILSRGTQKITVSINCRIPDQIIENILLEIAHFEPIEFPIYATGNYNNILIDKPIIEPENWSYYISESKMHINTNPKMYPYPKEYIIPSLNNTIENEKKEEKEVDEKIILNEALRIYYIEKIKENIGEAKTKTKSRIPINIIDWVIDFEHVVVDTDKEARFSLINITNQPITIHFDKQIMKSIPFEIDVDPDLKLLENKIQEIKIIYYSTRDSDKLNDVNYYLPFSINNGPNYRLLLKINLCKPTLTFSSTNIDFGNLKFGETITKYISLENVLPISIDWKLLNKNRSIKIDITAAHMESKEKMNIGIEWTPNAISDLQMKIPFYCHFNPKPQYLVLTGKVLNQTIDVSPKLLLFDNVQPYIQSETKRIKITNTCLIPIELFSLDYDEEYKTNEKILLDKFNSENIESMRVEPITVGESLPKEIKEKKNIKTEEEEIFDYKTEMFTMPIPTLQRYNAIEIVEAQNKKNFLILTPSKELIKNILDSYSNYYNIPIKTLDEVIQEYLSMQPLSNMSYVLLAYLSNRIEECLWNDDHPNKKAGKSKKKDATIGSVPYDALIAFWIEYFNKNNNDISIVIESNLSFPVPYLDLIKSLVEVLSSPKYGSLGIWHYNIQYEEYLTKISQLLFNKQNEKLEETVLTENIPDNINTTDTLPLPATESLSEAKEETAKTLDEYKSEVMNKTKEEKYWINLHEIIKIWNENIPNIQSVYDKIDLSTIPLIEPIFPPPPEVEDKKKKPQRPTSSTVPKHPYVIPPENIIDLYAGIDENIFNYKNYLPQFKSYGEWKIPSPKKYYILQKPVIREERKEIKNFKLLSERFRWIIEPNESIEIEFAFMSNTIGKYSSVFEFEVVGDSIAHKIECQSICDIPYINKEIKSMFLKTSKSNDTSFVKKKFLLNLNKYEFGPVLIGKNPEMKSQNKSSNQYCESIYLSNISLQTTEISVSMKTVDNIYTIEQTKLIIPPSERRSFILYFYPKESIKYENEIVITVKDNPMPIYIPVSGRGCSPILKLHGLQEAVVETNTKDNKSKKPDNKAKRSTTKEISTVNTDLSYNLNFNNILLTYCEIRDFTIENIGECSLSWFIDDTLLKAYPEIQFNILNGILSVNQKTKITVTFNSTKIDVYNLKLILKYSDVDSPDADETNPLQQCIGINLLAEVYEINVNLITNESNLTNNVVDFELIKSNESSTKTIYLDNKSRTTTNFNFSFRNNNITKVISVNPAKGSIPQNTKLPITLTFKSEKIISLNNNHDIRCQIITENNREILKSFPIIISGRNCCTLLEVVPENGIHFGTVLINETKEKTVQFNNNGELQCDVMITEYTIDKSPLSSKPTEIEPLNAKEKNKPKPKGKVDVNAGVQMQLSNFNISNTKFTILSGSHETVTIKFTSNSEGTFNEKIKIWKSNTFENEPMEYTLIAETIFPEIETKNYYQIFEEQTVVLSINAINLNNSTSCFGIEEQMLYIGKVIPSAQPLGISNRIRLSNTSRISANVNCSIESIDPEIYSIQPSILEIPAHEYRYITVYFKPKNIKTYEAKFMARITNGNPNKANELKFSIKGTSILPEIEVLSSSEINFNTVRVNQTRTEIIEIKNIGVIISKCHFNLQMDGIFEMIPSAGDVIELQPNEIKQIKLLFTPRQNKEYNVKLAMHVINNLYDNTTIDVKGVGINNFISFEDLPYNKENELYFNTFYLPTSQQLASQEIEPQKITFHINNNSDAYQKFTISSDEDCFSFVPSIGHIGPNGRKEITAYFTPSSAIILDHSPLYMEISRIEYNDKTAEENMLIGREWDNGQRLVNFITEEEFNKNFKENSKKSVPAKVKPTATSNAQKNKGKKVEGNAMVVAPPPKVVILPDPKKCENGLYKVEKMLDEPENNSIGEKQIIQFYGYGTADVIQYTCTTKEVVFSSTFMYDSRETTFTVNNTSKIPLIINWKHENIDFMSPFTIKPSECTINPSATQTFTAIFTPTDTDNYEITYNANIPYTTFDSVDNRGVPLLIKMMGNSLRPLCNFELEKSSYLTIRDNNRLNENREELPLSSEIKIVEIESLGIYVKNTRKFNVRNPTNIDYEFIWEELSNSDKSIKCVISHGICASGKSQTMIFEFLPINMGTFESFYEFKIPEQNIRLLFLIVGIVKEPQIYIEPNSINFSNVLINRNNTKIIHIVNYDYIPFNYEFDDNILSSNSNISISPSNGSIPPNGNLPIEVSFKPTDESFYNYTIPLYIQKKPSRLQLNIKGEGYVIHDKISTLDLLTAQQILFINNNPIELNLGSYFINEIITHDFLIENKGNIPFTYKIKGDLHSMLSFEPLSQTVAENSSEKCRLTFKPVGDLPVRISRQKVQFVISDSKTYNLYISLNATIPNIQFSFTSYNFGNIPIQDDVIEPSTTHLYITNNEYAHPISIQNMFSGNYNIDLLLPNSTILPGNTLDVPIHFYPKNKEVYNFRVPLLIQGINTQYISISGTGVEIDLDLVNNSQRNIKFNKCLINQTYRKTVPIINKSSCNVKFSIFDPQESAFNSLINHYITLNINKNPITLKPKEIYNLEITYNPLKRLPAFENKIFVKLENKVETFELITISGSCDGVQVILESSMLQFPTITKGNEIQQRLYLINEGDLSTNFKINIQSPHFSVTPSSGKILPYNRTQLIFTFKPTIISNDLRIENQLISVDRNDPLYLTLIGGCSETVQKSSQQLVFTSEVRKTVSQQISVVNPTSEEWFIHPIIDNSVFTGKASLVIPPKETAHYTLEFTPQFMNSDRTPIDLDKIIENYSSGIINPVQTSKAGKASNTRKSLIPQSQATNEQYKPYSGTIQIVLPNNQIMSYNLIGTATLPTPIALETNYNTAAKVNFVIPITIVNWMNTMEVYRALILSPKDSVNSVIKCPSSFSIPGTSSYTLQIQYYSYKQQTQSIDLMVYSERTKEYSLYKMNVTVKDTLITDTISLSTTLRTVAKQLIHIKNPFKSNNLNILPKFWNCSSSDVNIKCVQNINNNGEGIYSVEYRPLNPIKTTTELTIILDELGEYKYKLELEGKEISIDGIIQIKCYLGGNATQMIPFTYYGSTNQEFKCTLDSKEYICDNTVKVNACNTFDGVQYNVKLIYEPFSIGTSNSMLEISNAQFGKYKYKIIGVCELPQPQGPLVIGKNQQININFKNVFSTPKQFNIVIKRPEFSTNNTVVNIQEKKEIQIPIKYAGSSDSKEICSKVLITCDDLIWTYYLKGTEDEKSKTVASKKK